jgi:transposase
LFIIKGQDRNQYQFSCLDDRVSEGSIVRIIDKIVEILIPEPDRVEHRVGRPEYPMEALLKLYIYGYMHKISH